VAAGIGKPKSKTSHQAKEVHVDPRDVQLEVTFGVGEEAVCAKERMKKKVAP